jgi:hypothetical protein
MTELHRYITPDYDTSRCCMVDERLVDEWVLDEWVVKKLKVNKNEKEGLYRSNAVI